MKHCLFHLMAFFCLGTLIVSCEKASFLTLSTPGSVSFTDQGGTQSISFAANRDWTVSSSDSWCKVSPSSGLASEGDIRVSVSCEPNMTYDDRSCILTIKADGLVETITVNQSTNQGLLVSPITFELTNEAQTIDLVIRANVAYTIEIDPGCVDWISVLNTKALSSETLSFKIEANESYDPREGIIFVKQSSGSLFDEVKIKQQNTEEPSAIPIEDPVFKAYLVTNYDANGDGEISGREALEITTIEVETTQIKSVQGIEYMANLESLSCYGSGFGTGSPSDGQLKSLNVSRNTKLKKIDCFANQIKELDVSKNPLLSKLYCEGNQLTELDVASNYYLKELACDSNPLSTLNLSNNPILDKLYCHNNNLTTLDLSNNPALRLLDCTGNKLSQIDISDKAGLRVLECSGNELSSLDVSQNKELTSLLCHSNPLSSLDLSNNTKLVTLYCGGTPMSSIDLSNNKNLNYLNIDGSAFESIDLSNNSLLEYLYCIDCNLSSLDVGKNTKLKSLNCEWNQLTSLDLSNNTDLEGLDVIGNKITSLDVSHNTSLRSLQCRYNLLTTLDVSKNLKLSYLICSPMFDFYNIGPNMLSYLYISPGQEIPNVTVNRNGNNIPDGTCIIIAFDNIASIPEAVDLGLSVKWASFNLGASKPEEYGDYYAWGETEPYYSSLYPLTWKEGKEAGYTWSSYKWCMGKKQSLTKYCTDLDFGYNRFRDNKNVLDPEDDAASVKLGGSWRMPTDFEWTELRENCTWTWTTQNGVKGYQVTARNGISIFFPAAGYLYDTYLSEADSFGYYWYSSISTTRPDNAWNVSFASDGVIWGIASRICGFSIRPVYAE